MLVSESCGKQRTIMLWECTCKFSTASKNFLRRVRTHDLIQQPLFFNVWQFTFHSELNSKPLHFPKVHLFYLKLLIACREITKTCQNEWEEQMGFSRHVINFVVSCWALIFIYTVGLIKPFHEECQGMASFTHKSVERGLQIVKQFMGQNLVVTFPASHCSL